MHAIKRLIATVAVATVVAAGGSAWAAPEVRLPSTKALDDFRKDRGAQRRWNNVSKADVDAYYAGPYRTEFGQPAAYAGVELALQSLADDILKGSGLEPKIKVELDDCSDLNVAEGRKEGVLRLCRGTLALFQSQDHLAFLMSHELAHVILQHGRRDWRVGAAQGASTVGTLALMVAGGSSGTGWLPFMPAINQAIVVPSRVISGYRPNEEREADFLGVDLAIGAGYSPQELLCGAKFFLVADASGATDCRPIALRTDRRGVWGRIFGTNVQAVSHDEDGARYAALEAYIARFHAAAPDAGAKPLLAGANGATDPRVVRLLAAQQATMRVQTDLYRMMMTSISIEATPAQIADARAACVAGRRTLTDARSSGGLASQDRGVLRLLAALHFACGDRIGGARAFSAILGTPQASDSYVLEAYALAELADDPSSRNSAAAAWLAGSSGAGDIRYWGGRFRGACMLNSEILLEAVRQSCVKNFGGGSAYCESQAAEIRDNDACSKGLFDIYKVDASPQGYLRNRSAIYGDVLNRQLYP